MSKVFVPENYHSQLNLIETEVAIKMIKDYFERLLIIRRYIVNSIKNRPFEETTGVFRSSTH